MVQLTSNKVYVSLTATDMRKSFNTLAALVIGFGLDPMSGDLFVFANKRKNIIKILIWEKGGYWICNKRLEAGTVAIPFSDVSNISYTIEIDVTELRLLIEGITLNQVKKSKRFIKISQ